MMGADMKRPHTNLAARVLWIAACLPAAPACRATESSQAAQTVRCPCSECPVCKAEGDLACLQVKIRPDTPRLEYQGRTYWFCSEACREDFAKHPERYRGP